MIPADLSGPPPGAMSQSRSAHAICRLGGAACDPDGPCRPTGAMFERNGRWTEVDRAQTLRQTKKIGGLSGATATAWTSSGGSCPQGRPRLQ